MIVKILIVLHKYEYLAWYYYLFILFNINYLSIEFYSMLDIHSVFIRNKLKCISVIENKISSDFSPRLRSTSTCVY